jgi:peroxiredoxin
MSITVFNVLSAVLGVGVLIALVVGIGSLVAMIVRWKTAGRRRHVVRLLIAIAAIPVLIGVQQAMLWLIFLPALGREQMAQIDANREARKAASSMVHVGDPAPDFSLTTIDGEPFRLSDEKGNVVVINFFATWCGPCRQELPHVESIWMKHRDQPGFRLLVIGREESTEAVRDFRSENGFSFPMAADPDRVVFSLFATESIPRTVVVSPAGTVVYSQIGFLEGDQAELEAVIEQQFAALTN